MKRFLVLVSTLAILVISVGLAVSSCAQKFVYVPSKEIFTTPDKRGIEYQEVFIDSSGNLINGWYFPCFNAKLTVLFFHGNGGNISGCISTAKFITDSGLQLYDD